MGSIETPPTAPTVNKVRIIDVNTSFGRLSVHTTGSGNRTPLFCIHGNSSSGQIFQYIFDSNITTTRPVYAIDLPGHGNSDDAKDPNATYTMPAYARACVEVLSNLGYDEAVCIGWSLGGHVATEMLPLLPGMKGLGIIASNLLPIFPDGVPQNDRTKWNLRDDLSDEELTGFSQKAVAGVNWQEWMGKAAVRTDYRARQTLFRNLGAGDCSDQIKLVSETKVPTVVFVGTHEPVHPIDKIKGLPYGNLWCGTAFDIPKAHHCPVWEKPAAVVAILEEFLEDIA